MRYEDTSGSINSTSAPEARDDADTLANGSNGPATGNVITGAGTITGKAGADSPQSGHVVTVRGAGGTDTSDNGASLHVDGRFGTLVMDDHGNYKYVADGHAPANFRDLFQYTLADSKGGRSVADLVISRGGEIKVSENAQKVIPGPDGVVTLPAGVDLNDVHVVGRDLVINMPDGSQIVIVDGAVFVPQLVLGGVEVPSTNLAALLIDAEPRPAAGTTQSSGGNFEVPVSPLDPGVPLGDLIPPTELVFTPPSFKEVNGIIDRQPDAGTVSVQLDDDALAGGNPGGVGDDPNSVNATGFLPGSGGDGNLTWDLQSNGAPSGFSYVDGPNGSILVQQVQGGNTVTVLTITIDPTDGSYSVIQNAAILHPAGADENNVSFTINYTVTDQDGDSAPGTLNINVDDDTPTVSVTAGSDAEVSLTTHDAATIGAGSEAVSTSVNFGGVFSGSTSSPGADGAGVGGSSGYALSTTGGASGLFSHGVAINLYNVGGVIVGSTSTTAPATATDASVVFSVSTDNTGVVTLTQYQQIDHTADPHPTGAPFTDDIMSLADGSITLTRSVTVVDKDGDSVTGSASVGIGANLHFVDDGPSIGLAEHGEPTLVVDETDLSVNATASFAANFSASFGADGPAAAGSITYALGINAGATGLIDVATGQAIVLVQNGAVVEGHVGDAAGALAFTVSVNAAGDVTLDQIRALQHPDGTNPDDSVTFANDNLVTLTATAHDFDGDTASSTLNIGQNLSFEDDGPSISASTTQPTLTVDETVLATNASASFAGVFTSTFGADGAGTVTYALGISAPGANSGLVDTLTGQAIVLVQNGAVVEGHVGNAAGALAFTVTVDASGNVTLDQIRAVIHPTASNPDTSEGVTLSADNLVTLTATVTDKDGDHQSATANIGQNLVFLDDGPSAINDSDTIAPGGNTATGNVITGIGTDGGVATADNAGADQPGHITAIQGTDGTDTTFSAGVLSIHGSFGTLNIDADGNYTYNRDAGAPGSVDDVFTYTLTDADGDSTTATLTIHINDAAPNPPAPVTVLLDDDALAGGNAGGPGDRTPDTQNTSGNLVATGGDGDLDYFIAALQTLPTGFTSNLTSLAGVQTLQISQNGVLVITVTLVNETGAYTVTQNAPIMHALDGNTEGEIPLGNILSAINVNVFAQDADGDQSGNAIISISVDDDTPTVVASSTQPTLTVDETNLATNATASFSGVFTDSFGADGAAAAGSVIYTLGISAPGANSGLIDVATGSAIVLVLNGNVVEGHVGNAAGALAFTVSVDASGNVTLDQIRALSHPDANNPNDSVSPSADNLVTLTQTITDKDGDQSSATANIGQNLVFQDDGPSISLSGSENTLTVDETNLATNATAAFATAFNSAFGADGAGTVTYALTVTGGNGVASGLIDVATGSAIVLVNNAGVIEGHVGNAAGALAFTVSVDASGNVTLDQIRAVQHPDANNPNDSVSLSADNLVVLTATVTDKDGDHQSAALNIGQNLNFLDDGPSIGAGGTQPNLTVDESNLATNASASFAGVFTPTFGADGAGTVTYALGISAPSANSGLIDVATGSAIVLVMNGNVVEGHVATAGGALAFTVSVDASGNVTLDQIRALQHPDANNSNDSVTLSADTLVTLTATVTDKDGDHQSATANIGTNLNFLDDGPSISLSGSENTLTVDETSLATNATAAFATAFTSAFGADGAGAVTYALTVTGGNGVASGLVDTATGQSIVLVNNAGVIEGHVGNAAGALAFTVSVNAAGDVTLDQIRAVVHPNAADPNDNVTLSADNLVVLTATVTDKDGDHQSASLNIGTNLNFHDDGPSAAIGTTGQGVSIDESAGLQVDSNDVLGPLAVFAGVANKGVDPDMATQFAANASASVNSTGTVLGADGGTVAFSLNVSSAGVDSGLNTTDGHDILLFKEGNLIVGRVSGGTDDGKAAFAISIDSTGHLSMVEWLSIQHPNTGNPDDSLSIANGAVLAVVTATDGDNDTSSASTAIGGLISFQDSGPILTAVDNINIQNSGDVAATGGFHYLLGADGASADNNVFSLVTGSATVNGTAVTNYVINETSETASSAVYSFSFDYPNGTGTTAHETGTLTFDKTTGQYTVDLADPISGFSILATAGAPAGNFINYNPDGTTSQGPSNIATVQLANDFFIQFTGDSAGSHTTVAPDGTFVPVTTASFSGLELFTGSAATVTVSSSAAGVAGNTIQGGEVLDFNLYTTDPHEAIGTPTQNATSMFIELDGVGATEDMIVVLKLYDTVTHQYTTEALMVQNGDIIKSNATLAGTPYAGIVLDNNDGLIVIEPNDYQGGNANLVIVGAQIAGSDSGVTGTAINLNGGLGVSGGSSGTQAFSTDVNDNPFKIQNIGFLRTTTTDQNADLTFNVTVKDGDGDTITQTLHATVTAAADSATAISLSAAVTTVAPVVLDLNGDGAHFLATDAGVTYNYGHGQVATAWASPQDGILVNDANHDGNVSASEFVFGGNGVTDLQALSAFDSNHDGQLSSADANFGNFAVWQDANSNGAVDAGELQSLTARGIASISLSSDGISYSAAGGDVQVAGTGSYTRTDGSTGVLADAAFLTESRSATNTVLMGALAAAGLAAESSAAATTVATLAATTALTDIAAQHTQSFAPVALDAVSGTHGSDLLPDTGAPAAPTQTAALHASDAGQANGLSVAGSEPQSNQAPTELLQNSAPAQDGAGAGPSTAASIIMPAAAQLVAAAAHADVSGAQHNQVLGQVLADALHGGGSGPDIDSVLSSLPSQGGAHTAALEALASQAGAAVPNGDSSAFAGFTAANAAFTMEHMMVHVDAAPTHA